MPLKWSEKWREKLILPEDLESFHCDGTLATLNGSFDLLHAGHLQMIYEASQQADRLLVALNTDRSIQAYKSPNRPLVPLEQRLQMVAALEWVDYVTYFDETDPIAFLQKVQPDVHINGSEYGADCIEAAHVKRLHIVELVPGFSTTSLIKRIKQCDS